ncbi:MAG: glycosyltransferase [Planctomycetota bacterium]
MSEEFPNSASNQKPLPVTVIVPVRDGADLLDRCLEGIARSGRPPLECIVVDDASTDASVSVAEKHGAKVLRMDRSRGPAYARNRAAQIAQGELLMFVDADVVVHDDTLSRAVDCFEQDPGLTAVIGSYDDLPGDPSFCSQYKNMFHHWVHQSSGEEGFTFWSGCGMVRRDPFLALGGFNEGYPRPSIEDIEFGFRLRLAGHRIRLEKQMLATHLKHWTFFNLVMTDVFRRGVPWIALMLRDRFAARDLNLSSESQYGTVLTYAMATCLIAAPLVGGALAPALLGAAAACLLLMVWMHRRFYRFFLEKKGLAFIFGVLPMHLLFFLYSGLCIPLGMLAFLLDRRRARSTARGPAVRSLEPLKVDSANKVGP